MNCKICNNQKLEILELDNGSFLKCSLCKLIFRVEDDLVSATDEVRRYLTHNNSIFDSKYRNYLNKCINKLEIKKLNKNSKILDYGCGYQPVLSELLRKSGFDVYNYDLYFNSDERNLDLYYDAIVSIEVFEHFLKPNETIEQLTKLLKPGGKLFISTLLYPKKEDELNNWWYLNDETHITFYSDSTFEYIRNNFGYSGLNIKDNQFITLIKRQ